MTDLRAETGLSDDAFPTWTFRSSYLVVQRNRDGMQQLQLDLTPFDFSIAIVYLVAVVLQGLYAGFGREEASDYFLGKRSLPWYLIGLSLFATSLSGVSFIALLGASYRFGFVVFTYGWVTLLVLIFFAFFVLPSFVRTNVSTVPEYLEGRFDKRSRGLYALFSVFSIAAIDITGGLYLGGRTLAAFLPSLSLTHAVVLLAAAVGLYTVFGGMASVVATHTLQALLLLLGLGVLFLFGLDRVGGWTALHEGVAGEKLDLFVPAADGYVPWSGLLGMLLLAFHYWAMNQTLVQFTLGGQSLDQARKGALFAGFLKLPTLLILVVAGVAASVLYPGLAQTDYVFPLLAFDLPPVGFRGLLLAAFIAAIMSTLDAALLAVSTLVTVDFVKQIRPNSKPYTLARIGRVVGAVVVIGAAWAASYLDRFGSLLDYVQTVLAYFVPPFVAVYLAGLFWRRINETAACWTLLLGLVCGGALFVFKEVLGGWSATGLPDFHVTYLASLLFVFALLLLWIISLATYRPDLPTIRAYLYSEAHYRREIREANTALHKDFRSYALLLLVLSAGLIVYASLG